MGLNEDLGDRENVGNASLATARVRETQAMSEAKVEIPEPIPDDDTILNAMRGMSREADAALTKIVWKDGIDIELPNIYAHSFVSRITEPYRIRIASLQRELTEARGAVERLSAPMSAAAFKEYAHRDDWGVDCVYLGGVNRIIEDRASRTQGGQNRREEG